MFIAMRFHPFPFRTRQLSSFASKILGWRRPGKIDRCRHSQRFPSLAFPFIRAISSVGQSSRLITGWSWVRVPEGPPLHNNLIYGKIPERPKGTDCKSVVTDFGGSNPPLPTIEGLPSLADPFVLPWKAFVLLGFGVLVVLDHLYENSLKFTRVYEKCGKFVVNLW